jgi:hypothetical protein
MPTFEILCLANSTKRGGSCIAGLRLDGGGWIRPVALTRHGQLFPAHYILQDGSCPQIFDRIRISFSERRASAHQPENWLIADRPWQLVRRGLSAESAPLLQSNLTNGPALFEDFSRKILSDRFETAPALSSLSLIHPRNLRWRIDHSPYNHHKPSAQFQLSGKSYCLPVTDPAWLDAFREMEPGGLDPVSEEPEKLNPLQQPMYPREAGRVIQALAGGINPYTCEPLQDDGLLSDSETVRALRAASAALRSGPPRKRPRELPAHAGKAWDTDEEETLIREFEADETLAAIARSHSRRQGAIKSRLIRLGKIDDW